MISYVPRPRLVVHENGELVPIAVIGVGDHPLPASATPAGIRFFCFALATTGILATLRVAFVAWAAA